VTKPYTKDSGPDYNRIAENYDDIRPPVGVELILRAFSAPGTPLSNMNILDAGCGTGSYSLALAEHVRGVAGIDRSRGMIAIAEEKKRKSPKRARLAFTLGTMMEMPFRDSSFDGIMANQTLHHLGDGQSEGFHAHRKVLREFARILKPDGVIVVSTSSQEQIDSGFWFYHLIPQATRRLQKRFIPLPKLAELLAELGFRHVAQEALGDVVLQGDAYFESHGPLRAAWRNGDSAWSLASKEELAQALSTVRGLDARGELEEKIEDWDFARRHIGQITFVCASRHPCTAWSHSS